MSREEEEREIAVAQGNSYTQAANFMKTQTSWKSGQTDSFQITLACEKAEGVYLPTETGELEWKIPAEDANQHVEIAVQDKEDGRFLPHLNIHVSLLTKNGKLIEEKELPFLWHPFLFHYGANFGLPSEEEDEYLFEVFIEEPKFGRHDEIRGKKYKGDVRVKIGPVKLNPGRKPHGPE